MIKRQIFKFCKQPWKIPDQQLRPISDETKSFLPLISFRQGQINDSQTQNKIPYLFLKAQFPLIPLSSCGWIFYYTANPMDYFIMICYFKCSALYQSIQSGATMGYSLIEHEVQTDTMISTQSVISHFVLGSFGLVFSFFALSQAYLIDPTFVGPKMSCIIGSFTSFWILGLDFWGTQKNITPFWYLKGKIIIFIAQLFGFLGMYIYIDKYQNLIKIDEKDPYRQKLPQRQDIVDIKLPN